MEDPQVRRPEEEKRTEEEGGGEDDDEDRRRREEEIERLLLAQEQAEHNTAEDDEGNPLREFEAQGGDRNGEEDPLDVLLQQQLQYAQPRRISYVRTSFSAAVAVIYYALRTRQQWYLALVYLSSSKWAYIVLGNALVAFCISIFQFPRSDFSGNRSKQMHFRVAWLVKRGEMPINIGGDVIEAGRG